MRLPPEFFRLGRAEQTRQRVKREGVEAQRKVGHHLKRGWRRGASGWFASLTTHDERECRLLARRKALGEDVRARHAQTFARLTAFALPSFTADEQKRGIAKIRYVM